MRTQRDDMSGPYANDPAAGQEVTAEPIEGQVVPPPRMESEPDQPTDAVSPDDPAADPDRVLLDDPVQADDRGPAEDHMTAEDDELASDREPADDFGPAENGESATGSETVTDREPTEAPPLVTDDEAEDATPVLAEHEPTDAPPLVTDEVPATGEPGDATPQSAPGQAPVATPVAVADTLDTTPAAALAEQQWPAIQSLFVDDPRGAVERAEAAAGEVTAALIATLEREQADLRASYQQNADTEQLRTALQRYRAFCGRLEGLS